MYAFGPFSVDPTRRVLKRGDQPLPITARTFDVLMALLEQAGQTVGKDHLLRTVWPDTVVEEANLSQQIFTIRKLLGTTEKEPYIATVPRCGYRFVAPVIGRPPALGRTSTTGPEPPSAGTPLRLEIAIPAETPLAMRSTPTVAASPDGSMVVFVVADGGTTRLCLRRLNAFHSNPVPGSEGAANPFFSPDGRWLGFESRRRLWKVPTEGGKPFAVCEVAEVRGATWTARDEIIFAPGPATGLWRVAADGGAPQPLTVLDFDGGERTHRWPHALPDGDGVIFTIGHSGATSFDEASLALARLTGERRLVLQHATDGRVLPDRQLIWARGGSLLAAPFDAAVARLGGLPRIVAHGVAASATGAAHFSCSRDGLLFHIAGETQTLKRELVLVDRNGAETAGHLTGEMLEEPRWSRDGGAAILSMRNHSSDLWSYDFSRGTLGRLTFDGENFAGIYGPGDAITFSSSNGGPADLYVLQPDRSLPPELLVSSEFDKVAGAWSPDGQELVFAEYHPDTGADLWLLERHAGRPQPFVCTRFNEYCPVFAPDGRHIAYVTDESGRPEVVVVDRAGAVGKRQISTDGGTEPVWSRDGRELFYRSGNRLMRVDVSGGITQAGIPTTLFEGNSVPSTVTLANYDVSPDAITFLMIRAATATAPTSLRVTIGWHR